MAKANPSIVGVHDSSEDVVSPTEYPFYDYTPAGIRVKVNARSFLDGVYTNIHTARNGYAKYQGLLTEARNGKKRQSKSDEA